MRGRDRRPSMRDSDVNQLAAIVSGGVHGMAIDIRAQLENRLLIAPDTWERHLIVAQLVGSPPDLIDVGGLPKQLRSFLPNTDVSAVNVMPPADIIVTPGPLPFADQAYAAVTSLDALEHVIPTARLAFAAELVRVARDRAVVCCPLGSAEHAEAEQELQAWYRALTGADHPWLAEHIENGLPTLDELHELFDSVPGRVTFLFHGDFREVGRQFQADRPGAPPSSRGRRCAVSKFPACLSPDD